MLVLAQTTQQANTGFAHWTVPEWIAFFAALTGFITITLVPAIIAIMRALRAARTANENLGRLAQEFNEKVPGETPVAKSIAEDI
jgi:hypothetical protein